MPTVIVNYMCMALLYSDNNYWPTLYIQRSNFIVFLSHGSTSQDGLGLLCEVPKIPVEFEPAIPARERLQAHALDRTTTAIANFIVPFFFHLFFYTFISVHGFGGLGVACWPLVPKFAGSNPAEAVGFLGRKKSSARLPSEGK